MKLQISNTSTNNFNNLQTTNAMSNITKEIQTTNNLAKDKSQAVQEVLGYGVDSEGFFTSDLNEAAGIPKDIKIDSGLGVKYYLLSLPILGYYNNIDLKGSVKNFYNSFSKLSTQEQDNLISQAKETKYFLDNGKEEALNLKRFERFFKTDLGKLDIEI